MIYYRTARFHDDSMESFPRLIYCLQSRIVNNGVLTFLAGIQFCHDIAINPTSQNFLWIGGSRPPDPRLPQASSTGPPPAIAQFKRGAKTVGQCAGVVI